MSDKYNKTMKTLYLSLCLTSEANFATNVNYVCRLENLRVLELSFDLEIKQPTDKVLALIGQKCNKVMKLDLTINASLPESDQFFTALSEFKSIRKLKIELCKKSLAKGSIESLKGCKQLIDLHINYPELEEDFFTNINVILPKLQYIGVKTGKQFSDSFIDSFHSMKSIQKVYHFVNNRTEHKFNFWYFGKCLSEVMSSCNGMRVQPITANCGTIKLQIESPADMIQFELATVYNLWRE